MEKYILVLLASVLFSTISNAQNVIVDSPENFVVTSARNDTLTKTLKIPIIRKNEQKQNFELEFVLNTRSITSQTNSLTILTPSVTVYPTTDTVLLFVQILPERKTKHTVVLDMNVGVNDTTVQFTNKTFFIEINQFWAEETAKNPLSVFYGVNFDLLDKVSPELVYANIEFFIPLSRKRWHLYTSMYRTRYMQSISEYVDYSWVNLSQTPVNDNIDLLSEKIRINNTHQTNHLGLIIAPMYRFTHQKLKVYVSGYLEGLRLRQTNSYTYTTLDSTVTHVPFDETYFQRPSGIDKTVKTKELHIYQTYFGLGLPVMYSNQNYNFVVKLYSGGCYYDRADFKWFYLIQYRLESFKYGLAIGGEYRTFHKETPIISIFLAKSLDFGYFKKDELLSNI